MEKIEYSGMEIITLYLRKLEQLNPDERRTIIKAIELINLIKRLSGCDKPVEDIPKMSTNVPEKCTPKEEQKEDLKEFMTQEIKRQLEVL